jgi:hypothetical protein
MLKLPLHNVLLVAAALVLAAGTVEFFVLGQFILAPYVVAAMLIVLSLLARRWPRPVAFVCIAVSIVIPIGAFLDYRRGNLVWLVPVYDAFVFGWVLWNAVCAARKTAKAAEANNQHEGG